MVLVSPCLVSLWLCAVSQIIANLVSLKTTDFVRITSEIDLDCLILLL